MVLFFVGLSLSNGGIQSFSVAFVVRVPDEVIPGGSDGEAISARFCAVDELPEPASMAMTAVGMWQEFARTGQFQTGILQG